MSGKLWFALSTSHDCHTTGWPPPPPELLELVDPVLVEALELLLPLFAPPAPALELLWVDVPPEVVGSPSSLRTTTYSSATL